MGLAHRANPSILIIGVGLGYDFSNSYRTTTYKLGPTKPLPFEASLYPCVIFLCLLLCVSQSMIFLQQLIVEPD